MFAFRYCSKPIRLLVLALSLTHLADVNAADKDAALVEAARLMAAGAPAAAYALLAPLEPTRAGQPDFDYLLGISALDSGLATRAIFALERVLDLQPDNTLARAEIGRAYLMAGETDTARAELDTVRGGKVPPQALPAVDRLLGAIGQLQSQRTTQWRGYVEAGFGYDSNVNSATADSQVAIPALGGVLFDLSPDSRRNSDNFSMLGAGANVRVPLAPDLALAGNLSASRNYNGEFNQYDSGFVDANAGISKVFGKEVFSLVGQVNTQTFGGARFRDAYGVTGQWQHNIDSRTQSTVFVQTSRLEYPGAWIRNADRRVIGAGIAHGVVNGPVLFGSLYGGREEVRTDGFDNLGHHLIGARGGLQWELTERTTVFGTLGYEDRKYGGTEPFFTTARHDRQTSATLGVYYKLAPQWRLSPQVSYTDNRSDIVIYDFRRTVAQVTLRREF